MRVHIIDVGQGSAILVQFPCDLMLIDTGGERWPKEEWKPARYNSTEALMKYLDQFFKDNPDYSGIKSLVISHPHKDHTRGIQEVITKYSPKFILYNGNTEKFHSGSEDQEKLIRYANLNDDVEAWYVLEDKIDPNTGLVNDIIDPINCTNIDPEVIALWGQVRDDKGWHPKDFSSQNNHSLVIRINFGDASILFTGDIQEGVAGKTAGIERLVEKYKDSDLLNTDVLYVSHHGSWNGLTPELAQAVGPKIAVMSSGPVCERNGFSAWSHGHPRKATIDDLLDVVSGARQAIDVKIFEAHGDDPVTINLNKAIYTTGWDGTVILSTDPSGDNWVVETLGQKECDEF